MKQLTNVKNHIKWEEYYNPSFCWNKDSFYQTSDIFSEEFIDEFKDKINWEMLCEYYRFADNLLIKYKDVLKWDTIFWYQIVDENIIRKCCDKFSKSDWYFLFKFQILSNEFLHDFNMEFNAYSKLDFLKLIK